VPGGRDWRDDRSPIPSFNPGGTKLAWTLQRLPSTRGRGRLFRINGRAVGLDVYALTEAEARRVIGRHRGELETVAWGDWRKRLAALVQTLEKVESKRLILLLELNTRRGARLGSLALLKDRLYGLRLGGEAIRPAHLAALAKLDRLQWLDLGRCRQCGAGVQHLASLRRLRTLWLSRSTVTDADLPHLARLTSLRELNLSGTRITDAGLRHLRDLSGLRKLVLAGTRITSAGLKHLAGLTRLRQLDLSRTKIDRKGLARLAGMTGLRVLKIRHVALGMDGLRHLARLRQLRDLDLTATKISGVDLAALQGLPRLVRLSVAQNDIGDEGLWRLHRLRRLTALNLSHTKITDAGMIALHWLSRLEQLDLSYNKVTNLGIVVLGGLIRLQQLSLASTEVVGDMLYYLAALTGLRGLDLGNTHIRIADLAKLEPFADLTWLGLSHTMLGSVDDDVLKHLLNHSRLRRIDFWHSGAGDVEAFHGARPRCELRYGGPNDDRDSQMMAGQWPPAPGLARFPGTTLKGAIADYLGCPGGPLQRSHGDRVCDYHKWGGSGMSARIVARGSFLRPGRTEVFLKGYEQGHVHMYGYVFGVVLRWDGYGYRQVSRFSIRAMDDARILAKLRGKDGRDRLFICSTKTGQGHTSGSCHDFDAARPDADPSASFFIQDWPDWIGDNLSVCLADRAWVRAPNRDGIAELLVRVRGHDLRVASPKKQRRTIKVNHKTRYVKLIFDGRQLKLVGRPPCGTGE